MSAGMEQAVPRAAGTDRMRLGRLWAVTASTICGIGLARSDTPATQEPAEATVTCLPTECFAVVFEQATNARVCVGDGTPLPLTARRAPRFESSTGPATSLVRDGAKWCVVVRVGESGEIVSGAQRRRISISAITPTSVQLALPKAPLGFAASTRWTAVGDAEDWKAAAAKEDVEGLSVDLSRVLDVLAAKEPVTPPAETRIDEEPAQKRAKEPTPPPAKQDDALRPPFEAPDDRSFIDVVAVGDADGFHCTGILIAKDLVLTAGHCLPAVRIGLGNDIEQMLLTVDIAEAIAHPAFDVAALRLQKRLEVPLRARLPAGSREPHGIARIVGFGVDEPRKAAGFGVKRRVDVGVEGWGCDRGRALTSGCHPATEMVIAGVGGRDTCWGDSGGPVLASRGDSLELIAITSRPVARGGAGCGRGGVYVRVDALSDWLGSIEGQP